MTKEKNKGGRPAVSEHEKYLILSKVEPYLKKGLSIRKSLHEAKISRATFYRIMEKDERFRDQIARFQQYISVLVCKAIYNHLLYIREKQTGNEEKNISPQKLDKDDIKFLFWFALNSPLTKEEYGEKSNGQDYVPEEEIHKLKQMIDKATTKKIEYLH